MRVSEDEGITHLHVNSAGTEALGCVNKVSRVIDTLLVELEVL